jgi:predicted phosphodiesterase
MDGGFATTIARDGGDAQPDCERERFPVFEMNGPVLVFGGCYSNLEAIEALRADAKRWGIPPERKICTGDVVAYCADPVETIALLRGWNPLLIMGNCEEALGWHQEGCGCGFAEGTACHRNAVEWYAYADAAITEEERRWMRSLPRRIDILIGGRRLAVVHGAVDSINRFIFASTPWAEKRRQIDLAGCDGVIGGHCGIPFTEAADGRLWHNAGAIGMPANDGTSRGWYSLLIPTPAGIKIRGLPLEYDWASAARKMRERRLPAGYSRALETGLWPSCDVLPAAELHETGNTLSPGLLVWNGKKALWPKKSPRNGGTHRKFLNPDLTASGEQRARVSFIGLETLWFNTGTLCNLACQNCYIESSPRNDRLVYLTREEVRRFLDEARSGTPSPDEIGFTGGEPFMNPDILGMIEDSLGAGFNVLVLTNAMRPMQRSKTALLALHHRFPGRLALRVSLDHYEPSGHEDLRGPRTWQRTLEGLIWLARNGLDTSVAGRMVWNKTEAGMRAGYRALFADLGLPIDADDPARLVLFPELTADESVPEITESCWPVLGKTPGSVMCSTSRMVVKRRGAPRPAVVSCTLLPYDERFEMGATLAEATGTVKLNHRYCAQFCVLGGASCSAHS